MLKVIQHISITLAGALGTVLVGAFAVFMVMQAAPGDPALVALGEAASPEAVADFRARHNLDAPILQQFWFWLQDMLLLDFGKSLSIAGGSEISNLIAFRLPNTVFLGIYALVIAVSVALVVGTIAALQRGRFADTAVTSGSVLGISMPDFWLAYILILVFALQLDLLPAYGFTSPMESVSAALTTGLLPALAMAAPLAAVFSRILRASLLDNSKREYVSVAKSFGFSSKFVFVHYIFRNSLIPFIVIIGLQVRYILGGVVVIEKVFGVAGVGSLMVDAAFGRDYPVVQACAVTFLGIVIFVNFSVDTVCTLLDPRRTR